MQGKSTFLIKSTENKSFGTGFCFDRDEDGSYILTCQHVVEACGEDSLYINEHKAEVQKGSDANTLIDLAVIYVKRLEAIPLKLSLQPMAVGVSFCVNGFKSHKPNEYKLEPLEGSIKKTSKIHSDNESIDTYELSIGDDDKIEKGYSGSGIVSKQSGQVIAVATDRVTSGKQAYAIPLKYLKEVWHEFNPKLFDMVTPFVGLSSFDREDKNYFFGRDEEVNEILLGLQSSGIMAIIGDSGSGKSSLIKAGVIPKLLHKNIILETRPTKNPFIELAHVIAKFCEDSKGFSSADIGYFRKEIKSRNRQNIHTVFEQLFSNEDRKLLLYIDQFEELFTLCSEDLEKSFIDTLLYLLEHQSSHFKINIVFTMRRDYYNLLSSHQVFNKIIEDSTYLVRRMNDDKLKEVIRKPLELLDVESSVIEKLTSIILDDMGDEAKEITLLQIALTETWRRRGECNYDLLESYINIGKVKGALSILATNAMKSLDEQEKELFKYIFIRIVKFSDIGGFTRRLADKDEFSHKAWDLVQRLSSDYDVKYIKYRKLGRLLKLSTFNTVEKSEKQKSNKKEVVELIHEALIMQWKPYVNWLQESNKNNQKRIHESLIEKSKIYKKNPKQKFLLTGYTLEESSKLLEQDYKKFLSFDEKTFIEASEKRERQIRFWKFSGVSTLVFLVGLSAYFAYIAHIVANDIKHLVHTFAKTDSRVCGHNVIKVYKEAEFILLKHNQMKYLAYIYSELGDNYLLKKNDFEANSNYIKALNHYKRDIKLQPKNSTNYLNVLELELILNYEVNKSLERDYLSMFSSNYTAMYKYRMLKILRDIAEHKSVNLDEWIKNNWYGSIDSWRFSSLYIWAIKIKDKKVRDKVFEALKVFDEQYGNNRSCYEAKLN